MDAGSLHERAAGALDRHGLSGNAAGQVLAITSPIADALAVGPDPNGPGPATDDGMKWLSDFDRAIAVGMGCKIPLTGAQTRGFNRIVVLGLRSFWLRRMRLRVSALAAGASLH